MSSCCRNHSLWYCLKHDPGSSAAIDRFKALMEPSQVSATAEGARLSPGVAYRVTALRGSSFERANAHMMPRWKT